MPRFSANVTMLFGERPVLERPMAAARAGFGAFEVQFPYDLPVEDWRAAKARSGLPIALFNLPAGDFMAGGPGLAAMPGRQGQFRAGVAEARLYAEALRPACLNILAGCPPDTFDRKACRETLIENARYAAEAFASLGVMVVVEPINTRDRPGFLVATAAEAIATIEEAGHPNLGLQLDLYHAHIMGDDPVATTRRSAAHLRHVQVADAPGRHEPGTGGIDFAAAFAALDEAGYTGWVGAEYVPSAATEDSLAWMQSYRRG